MFDHRSTTLATLAAIGAALPMAATAGAHPRVDQPVQTSSLAGTRGVLRIAATPRDLRSPDAVDAAAGPVVDRRSPDARDAARPAAAIAAVTPRTVVKDDNSVDWGDVAIAGGATAAALALAGGALLAGQRRRHHHPTIASR